jgi:hypothetical protein
VTVIFVSSVIFAFRFQLQFQLQVVIGVVMKDVKFWIGELVTWLAFGLVWPCVSLRLSDGWCLTVIE